MADKNTLLLQSCADAQSEEYDLYSEGGEQSADGSSSVVSFKIEEEEIQIKEEEEPIAVSFPSIKDEPEVSPKTFHQYCSDWNRFETRFWILENILML
jgi:hypothetical protein